MILIQQTYIHGFCSEEYSVQQLVERNGGGVWCVDESGRRQVSCDSDCTLGGGTSATPVTNLYIKLKYTSQELTKCHYEFSENAFADCLYTGAY